MGVVLIVDDQAAVRAALELLLEVHGLPAVSVASAGEAISRVERGGIGAVLQDMNFRRDTTSGEEGVALFRRLRSIDPGLPVLLMTAWTSLETAVSLVRDGAADYVQKPWNDEKLVASLKTLLVERAASAPAPARPTDLGGLLYTSRSMHDTVELALRVARSDAPVLILGPNGSGKEKLAELIVGHSRRATKPFVRVNAGAIPEPLLESELFGVEAGAYTGATKVREGHFEAANGGTLFLDEIGSLSLAGQQKLLRVVQTGELQRLGSSQVRRVDARIISATNEDLRAAVARRMFREDLYFRLNVVELHVPSLAARREDVLPLAEAFLLRAGPRWRLSEAARHALSRHDFPGNVRELENRVTRATIVATSLEIAPADLGLGVEVGPDSRRANELAPEVIARTLAGHDGNISRAAAELGLSRQALYRRLEKLGPRR